MLLCRLWKESGVETVIEFAHEVHDLEALFPNPHEPSFSTLPTSRQNHCGRQSVVQTDLGSSYSVFLPVLHSVFPHPFLSPAGSRAGDAEVSLSMGNRLKAEGV